MNTQPNFNLHFRGLSILSWFNILYQKLAYTNNKLMQLIKLYS